MTAKHIVAAQVVIGMVCTGVFFLVNQAAGTSALLATSCVLLPTMYYAWVQARTLNATRILVHGVLKMITTMVAMAVAIVVIGIEPVGFFVTLIALQLSYLASMFRAKGSEAKREIETRVLNERGQS